MANRYNEIFKSFPQLYLETSPVLMMAGALLEDTVNEKNLVLLKLKNLAEDNIISCKVSVQAFDEEGKTEEGITEYCYEGLDICEGQEFGAKEPIYLSGRDAKTFCAAVTEVTFKNGQIWQHSVCEWKQVPMQEAVVERISEPEILEQYELEAGKNSAFVPIMRNGLFQCTCGTTNLASAKICHRCKRSVATVNAAFDIDALKQKREERLQREAIARAKAEAARVEAMWPATAPPPPPCWLRPLWLRV